MLEWNLPLLFPKSTVEIPWNTKWGTNIPNLATYERKYIMKPIIITFAIRIWYIKQQWMLGSKHN